MPVFDERLPTPEAHSTDLPTELPTIFEFVRRIWDQLTEWIGRLYKAA